MHQCENVDVYLYCSSEPIIEFCGGVRIAPLPGVFEGGARAGVVGELKSTGGDVIGERGSRGGGEGKSPNRWNQVQDFQWIKAEHSPNWCEIPLEERVGDGVWREVVGGDESVDIDEILKNVTGGMGKGEM